MKTFAVAAVVVLIALVPHAAAAQRLPRTVVPTHYDLSFSPDLTKATFSGREAIDVDVPRATSTVVLNAAEIEFRRVFATTVASDGTRGEPNDATFATDERTEMATLSFARPITEGTAQIHIEFTGTLNDKLRGFYLTRGKQRNYAATQFEATDARRAFPCFDEPDLKATYSLAFVVDVGDTVLANTSELSDVPGPVPGKHTIRFADSAKMSTYLVAFAVGDWKCVKGEQDGIPLRICGTPDKAPLGAYALEWAKRVVQFYNVYFGIKYPFGKLDSLGLPDFAAGAMENAGLITWREALLFADEKTASEEQKHTVASIMAHEVGHMWFGDLVTMKWWDDVWLNEGFATWVTSKPLAAAMPEWNMPLRDASDTSQALATDSLQSTRPIRAPGTESETPDQIALLFDGVAYGKTASVLRMVEAYVGEGPFRQGVRAYLRKFSYGNATAEDFWTTVARETGKPVDAIMSSYVKNAGAPLLDVGTTCERSMSQVTVSQRRFVADPDGMRTAAPEVWTVPVCMSAPSGAPVTCVLLTQAQQTFGLPACEPWVFANAGSRGHYRVEYTKDDLSEIAAAAPRLVPTEQIALARDSWALIRAGRLDIGPFLAIGESLRNTDVPEVLRSVTDHLGFVESELASDANRDAFRAWMRSRYAPRLRELGWEPKAAEPNSTKEVRAALIGLLATARDPDVLAEARRLANRVLDDYASVDPSIRAVVVTRAATSGDAALYERYAARLGSARTPAEYYLFLGSLAWFEDPALQNRTLAFALTPDVRPQDMGQLLASMLVNPETRRNAWTFVTTNWDRIVARLPEGLTVAGALLADVSGSFCTAAQRQAVADFFERHPLTGNDRPLRRALESIDSCIGLREREQAPLATWLASQHTQ